MYGADVFTYDAINELFPEAFEAAAKAVSYTHLYNIQWFPGHMTKTLRMMEQEIQHVDASLVLLDARIPLSDVYKRQGMCSATARLWPKA